MSADVLYSFEQASVFDLDHYCEQIRAAKQRCRIPIIASIHCATEQGWVEAARCCAEAGADAIELNVSCPHGVHVMSGGDLVAAMEQALGWARSACSVPLMIKLSPQMDSPTAAAMQLEKAGASALVMFNRFTGLDIDVETLQPILHGGYAGHGGPWAIHYVLRWLSATYPHVRIPLIASGGIWDGEGALKAILAGVTAVQVCTAAIVQGPQVIRRIVSDLEELLEAAELESVDAARGTVCKRIVPIEKVDRQRKAIARIEALECTSCGTCAQICFYDAVRHIGGTYVVDAARCDGCGLCAELCPVGAISMVPITAGGSSYGGN